MSDTQEAKVDMDALANIPSRPLSKELRPIRSCHDVIMELAYERRDVSEKLAQLERVITINPESVSDHHKDLWRKQAEAMRTYKEVLGERIKDLIDN
jgi:hypothetical protein